MMTKMTIPLQLEIKLQELQGLPTMTVRFSLTARGRNLTVNFLDDEEDEDYIESFFDGILGDDDGKNQLWSTNQRKWQSLISLDDDDDEDDSGSQPISQPAQQATQQISSSPIASDAEANIGPDSVADNIDDLNSIEGQADVVESDAKDPQQAAQDQAATINNTIDPVGNEAIVDDEEGMRTCD